ncbi:hypothetical protein [Endozoicomonas sp. 4G]|uniref:hypothetical protein n=1 Tax=Endozoicomonas sp. 4G TaxID=2872754 RepID=UPI002078F7FD|nr:hypothetical protein [Endozoicomonas sp. 4G]
MNAKHRKTLTAVFRDPTPKQLEWKAIEALLIEMLAQTRSFRGGSSQRKALALL